MFWKKKPRYTEREEEIRDYIMQEFGGITEMATKSENYPLSDFDRGRIKAAETILGNILFILKGGK